jgi:hypothetical protein
MADLEQLRLAAFPTAIELVPIVPPPPIVAWVRVLTTGARLRRPRRP